MHLILIYASIFIGIILEGEMVMLSSVIAAHRGHLTLWVVMVIGFTGTLTSDWLYFLLGRYQGSSWISKRPKMQQKALIINKRIRKNQMLVLLSYRFLYGLRAITPFVLGTSTVKITTFIIYSTLTTLVWCILYGFLGYFLGEVIRIWLKDIEKVEFYVIGLLLLTGIIIYLIPRIRNKSKGITNSANTDSID